MISHSNPSRRAIVAITVWIVLLRVAGAGLRWLETGRYPWLDGHG